MAKALTDTELKKAIKARCKDCCPDGKDEKLCKSCSISKITETNIIILSNEDPDKQFVENTNTNNNSFECC